MPNVVTDALEFTTVDWPWEEHVTRRAYCRACNLAIDARISRELAPPPESEEPTEDQLAEPFVRMIDAMTGGPERRKQRLEWKRLLERVDGDHRRKLATRCPHASRGES